MRIRIRNPAHVQSGSAICGSGYCSAGELRRLYRLDGLYAEDTSAAMQTYRPPSGAAPSQLIRRSTRVWDFLHDILG